MSGLFNPTVAWITTRATLGRRRALLFAIPAVVLILVTVALKASRPPSRPWPSHVLGTFGFSVLLPLTALIIGSSVLGAEIDDGSVIHLLATPVRRSSVIITKFLVATGLTMIFAAVPELIAALISGGGSTEAVVTFRQNGPPTCHPGRRRQQHRLRRRPVRRGAGRRGDLQRDLRHGLGRDHPRDRGRPALRADLGGAAVQLRQRGAAAVGQPLLPRHRQRDRPRQLPERGPHRGGIHRHGRHRHRRWPWSWRSTCCPATPSRASPLSARSGP